MNKLDEIEEQMFRETLADTYVRLIIRAVRQLGAIREATIELAMDRAASAIQGGDGNERPEDVWQDYLPSMLTDPLGAIDADVLELLDE